MFQSTGYPSVSQNATSEEKSIQGTAPIVLKGKPIRKAIHKREKKQKAKADKWCMPKIREVLQLASTPGNTEKIKTLLEDYNKQWGKWIVDHSDYVPTIWQGYFLSTLMDIQGRMVKNISGVKE